MQRKEIEKKYIKKIKELKEHNKAYFDKDKPVISDSTYDKIKLDILNLEKKYKFLNNKDSPSKKVGYEPSGKFKKVEHDIPMLSLANAFSIENIKDYLKKIKNFLNIKDDKKIKHLKPMLSLSNAFEKEDMKDFLSKISNFLNTKDSNIELSSESKIDGISASLTYKNGLLTKGLSRGDGIIGEDILQNLLTINSIPKKIEIKNIPNILELRAEIYIGKKDFETIKDNFANPRNAAGGS